jgi:hypothetical protein
MMFPKTKRSKRGDKKSKLDAVFSKYIRLRDSVNGLCTCCTCGQVNAIANTDAGHFISRNHLSTRYNQHNVNAQCQRCNRFLSGNQFEHSRYIDKKYGIGTAEKLLRLSKLPCKYCDLWYDEHIKYYRDEIKKMK